MEYAPTALMLMAMALVTTQGTAMFLASNDNQQKRYTGILNLILAGSAFMAFLLFASGALILSPEYGVLLAQGSAAWIWSLLMLIVIPVGVGLTLHAGRCAHDRPNRLRLIVLVSILAGVSSVAFTLRLNPGRATPFQIYCVDLWTFSLLAWVVVCLGEWLSVMFRVTGRLGRIGIAAFWLSCFSVMAIVRSRGGFHYADTLTLRLWVAAAWVGVPTLMAVVTSQTAGTFRVEVLARWRPQSPASNDAPTNPAASFHLLRYVPAIISGIAGAVIVLALTFGASFRWPISIFGIWALVLLVLSAERLYRGAGEWLATDRWSKGYWDDFLALLSVLVMIACIADLSHYTLFDPTWDLCLLIVCWVVLLEIVNQAPLCRVLRNIATRIFRKISGVGAGLEAAAAAPGTAPPEQKSGGLRIAGSVVFKTILTLMVLIAISEVFNARKTIVQPFTVYVGAEADKGDSSKNAEFGKAVADRVVSTIGLLGQELRPDLMVASKDGKQTWVPASSDQAGDVQAAVAGNTLQLPGMSTPIPLGFFVSPVQRPIRHLLGVRVIQGTIQMEAGHYILLASSSTGQYWRVPEDGGTEAPAAPAAKSPMSAPDTKKGSQAAPAGESTNAVLEHLADQLAYMIVSSDANLTRVGMTSSWKAIKDFLRGLERWNKYKSMDDYDALSGSIEDFRSAIRQDPAFALAYYRLGLALQMDGQPGAAIAAFRDSIEANPRFVAGHIALADVLAHYEQYMYPPPAYFFRQESVAQTDMQRKAAALEAERLLHHVVRDLASETSVADRSAAYVALCRNTFDDGNSKDPYVLRSAFFYCKRAEYLYSRIAPSLRDDVRTNNNEAWALYLIGNILSMSAAPEDASPASVAGPMEWTCDEPLPGNSYVRSARRYYEKALEFQPDNGYILCSVALAKLADGDKDAMRVLAADARARIARAERLHDMAIATDGDEMYQLIQASVGEYQRATDLDPFDPDALNNHAYSVYEWRLLALARGSDMSPSGDDYRLAALHSQEARRLTEKRGTRSHHAIMQSTAGEVLMGDGRPDQALQVLREIIRPTRGGDSDIGQHAYYDETRVDLAQAYACVLAYGKKATADARADVEQQLKIVREHEEQRESRRFRNDITVESLKANCEYLRPQP